MSENIAFFSAAPSWVEETRSLARLHILLLPSENVFADLGLPDAETRFVKAQIIAELYRRTNEKLTHAKAGELMGISQPEVSRLFKGIFREYPVDRLVSFLTAFDSDEIVSRPPDEKPCWRAWTHQLQPALRVASIFELLKVLRRHE